MALAEEIVRRLRRAAYAGKLRQPVGLDVELEAGLDDGGADRIMPTARAQRRNRTFVVPMREAERIFRQRGMVKLRFGDIGHLGTGPGLVGSVGQRVYHIPLGTVDYPNAHSAASFR